MNKRIRKKHLKRTLSGLLAAYDEYEAARVCAFRKALQVVTDTCENPRDVFSAYMEIASLMASSGPPPRFLTESIAAV